MSTEDVKKKAVASKAKAVPKPSELTIDTASALMIERSRELEIETIFDRAQTMKPCNIGVQGTCCKNCSQGPCRLPLPKGGIDLRPGGVTMTISRPISVKNYTEENMGDLMDKVRKVMNASLEEIDS